MKMKKVYVDDKKLDEIENAFRSLKKQAKENEMKEEMYYIDYFGEIIPLSEAIDRFMEVGRQLKK